MVEVGGQSFWSRTGLVEERVARNLMQEDEH
jgi:hypothetical protein